MSKKPLITIESSLRFNLDCEKKRSADLLDEVRELKGLIAKKDAALDACVEALDEAKTYTSSPSWSPSMTEDIESVINQAKEARK